MATSTSSSTSIDSNGADITSLVTIVIVTSPTSSNPSTELIDRCLVGVIRSFPQMENCKVVIACDGVHVVDTTSVSRRNCSTKRIFGKCNKEQLYRYQEYCEVLKSRSWLQVDRQNDWQGFALTLQSALQKNVSTPLAMVLPHDYELTPSTLEDVNLPILLNTMLSSSDINYVGLPNPRSSKFGSRHAKALKGIPTRIVQGANNEISHTLEPLAIWKENPHFAKVEAYQSIVFGMWRYKRGQFIEDTMGQNMLAKIKAKGLEEFHFTYLLSLREPCSFHMDGPRYLPVSERQARKYSVHDFEIEAANQAREYVTKRDSC